MSVRHKIRTETGEKVVRLTARRAIIAFCRECTGWNRAEVRACTATICPLYPFRTMDTPQDTV